MCLGYPGVVVRLEGTSALIDCWGTRKMVRFDALNEALQVGDLVIEHEGQVVRRISPDDADMTLELYETVLAEA